MDRLFNIEVFVAVAETGNFSRAADRLRVSAPVVTRAIAALEAQLGVRVYQRTTRSVMLTDAGRRLLESAHRVLAELESVETDLGGETTEPHGRLVLTASVTFGRRVLAPIVNDFMARFTRVSTSLVLLDRIANLIDEGIDLAVRIGHLPDSSLVARRLGSVRRVLVAAPDYLDRFGHPESPTSLRDHAIIAFTGLMPYREWRFEMDGKSAGIALRPRLESNDALVAIEAAEAGHGITLALSYMVAPQIRPGALRPVLESFWSAPQPVHLVFPHAVQLPARVRAFIDFAAPQLEYALVESSWADWM